MAFVSVRFRPVGDVRIWVDRQSRLVGVCPPIARISIDHDNMRVSILEIFDFVRALQVFNGRKK